MLWKSLQTIIPDFSVFADKIKNKFNDMNNNRRTKERKRDFASWKEVDSFMRVFGYTCLIRRLIGFSRDLHLLLGNTALALIKLQVKKYKEVINMLQSLAVAADLQPESPTVARLDFSNEVLAKKQELN